MRSRTLKTKSVEDRILSEDVIFYAYGKCPTCNNVINLINLCSNLSQLKTKSIPINNNSNSLFASITEEEENSKKKNTMEDIFKCPYKHQKESAPDYFRIILRMNYGIELFNLKLKSNEDYTSKSIKTLLMSPSTMKNELLKLAKNLENEREKFDVENFKFNNLRLFWNLIWYFELNQMDSSFMLPYTNEVQNDDNLNLENLKKFIDTKYIPEKDINI
jgi:hypothetical protein